MLTDRQVSKLINAYGNNSSANTKLLKNELPEIVPSRGFFDRLLRPLLKNGLPLMRNIQKPFAKTISMSLELIPATS